MHGGQECERGFNSDVDRIQYKLADHRAPFIHLTFQVSSPVGMPNSGNGWSDVLARGMRPPVN
jgi:hypothetical protein